MTINEVNERIKNIIEDYGFVPVLDRFHKVCGVETSRADYLGFYVSYEADSKQTDWESGKVVYKVVFGASIRQMGGNPSPEELLTAANQIRKGALMVKKINKLALSFTA